MGKTEIKISLEVGHTSENMSKIICPNQDMENVWGAYLPMKH